MDNSSDIQQAKTILLTKFKPFGNTVFDFYKQGAWEKALIYLRNNIDINEGHIKDSLHQLGQALNNFALLTNRHNNLEWAEKSYNFALMIHIQLLDPYNPDSALTLYNMGLFLRDKKNDLDGAFDCLAQSLEIWKSIIRQQNESGYIHYLASSLHALGGIFAEKEEYARARQNLEQALELRISVYRSEHPEIAQSYGDLGTLYFMTGDLPEARKYLSQSYKMYRITLGENDPMTQSTFTMLQRVVQMMS